LILVMLLMSSMVTISAGHRGVVLRFGAVQDKIMGEGLHFKTPLVETVKEIDVRIMKEETDAAAVSRDVQSVTSKIAVNYHIDPTQVGHLYQTVGTDFKVVVIDPAVQEVFKAVTARNSAGDLISRRENISQDIKSSLATRLQPYGIIVDQFNITNFDFSPEFNAAIESKQAAEQLALKAQNDKQRIQYEADQKVISAKAEAESLALQKQSISPELLQLRAIEKWDGHLPTVTGGAMPFIDVSKAIPSN
ncbi:MAG: prohibitin family protein, partial [Bacillota bacterium]